MKRSMFIILVTILLVLILIYFYNKREVVLNKVYQKDLVHVEYPYFHNELIDEYIKDYLSDFLGTHHILHIDYDYVDEDYLVDLTFYVYEEWDGIVKEDFHSFQIDLVHGTVIPVSNSFFSRDDDFNFTSNYFNKKVIALTFDDGPNYQTNKVLDILEKYGVKATFFVLGCNIHGNEDKIRRMNDLGMEIGNHMYSHKLLSRLSKDEIILEYQRVDELVFDVIGRYPSLIRPSYGTSNARILEAVDRPVILWNIDTLDWKYHNSKKIFLRVVEHVQEGDIILMHDIYKASSNSLELIIPKLLEDGYQFVTVSELFSSFQISLDNGKVYSRGY